MGVIREADTRDLKEDRMDRKGTVISYRFLV